MEKTTITVASEVVPMVNAFVAELGQPERPGYLAAFPRRLAGETGRSSAPRERQSTASQKTIVVLCFRTQGATGKELARGCG